jgi:hypothetical protein
MESGSDGSGPQRPFTDCEVRLAVIDGSGTVHALVFPCRRVGNSWIDSKLRRPVEVNPTHWQEWTEAEHHNQ